ncbi:hypothetical protein Bpfe_017191 [Biomphalaria pfeifferi]|uniref:Uncharacterized protein n=1 Tax=Biomphalaria pfeifferi TaxID=112525 RepID=A0AAD8BEV6_BIOPF|nr:hypothetical protein Bpfe_017191 [Biomphalaria pfeifferi]
MYHSSTRLTPHTTAISADSTVVPHLHHIPQLFAQTAQLYYTFTAVLPHLFHLYHSSTKRVPHSYQSSMTRIRQMYHIYTKAQLHLYHRCTKVIPQLFHTYTPRIHYLDHSSTTRIPQLYFQCLLDDIFMFYYRQTTEMEVT